MEVDKIVNSCRVCRTGNQDGDFESLYVVQVVEECGVVESGTWQLTEAGKLYEEMLGLEINESTMEIYPQYLCNSCDLQMRLFRKLTLKARRTLEALSKLHIIDNYNINKKLTTQGSLTDSEEYVEQYLENETSSLKLNERVTQLEINPAVAKEELLEQEHAENPDPVQEQTVETLTHELEDTANEVFQTLADSDATSYYITLEDSNDANTTETTTQIVRSNSENITTSINVPNFKEINDAPNCKEIKLEPELLILSESGEFFDVHYLDEIEENSMDGVETKTAPATIIETVVSEKSTINCVGKRSYECHACDLEFVKRTDFQKHRKSVHANKFPCPDCPKLLNTSDALRVHIQLHRGQPAYKCELCQRTFNQKVHYKYHMDKHNNVRNFKCTQCHKAFLSKADLSVHMRSHTGERPYECEICGKTYLILQHLKMHRYSHFGRTFECKICDQKFISPSTLRTHIKTIHSSEPRFQCEFCVKRFKRKHHLIAHYKVHQKPITHVIDRNADIDDPVVDNCELVRDQLTEDGSSADGFMEIGDVAQIESILVVDDDDVNGDGDAAAHTMYGNENVIVF